MGGSKKQTVGFWYRPIIKFGLCQGPIDAFLQFRGGDRPAWEGELTVSGPIQVDAPELWGGTDSEGGLQGPITVRLGEQDQAPSAYLLEHFPGPQSAFRGKATIDWEGGRYGAMNPYPKPASFKIRRILKGWDENDCWYPGKAAITFGEDTSTLVAAMASTGSAVLPSIDGLDWSASQLPVDVATWLTAGTDRYVVWNSVGVSYTLDGGVNWITSDANMGGHGGNHKGVFFKGAFVIGNAAGGYTYSVDGAASFINAATPQLNELAASPNRMMGLFSSSPIARTAATAAGPWVEGDEHGLGSSRRSVGFGAGEFKLGGGATSLGPPRIQTFSEGGTLLGTDSLPAVNSALLVSALRHFNGVWVAGTDSGEILYKVGDGPWLLSADQLGGLCLDIVDDSSRLIMVGVGAIKTSSNGANWAPALVGSLSTFFAVAALEAGSATFGLKGMNPAHIIYDALNSQNMQGEPGALINEASFAAAADKFYAEQFGLCTKYDPDAETVDQFVKRICSVAGASASRSRSNGQWYLDLIRGDYDLGSLPVLRDADILEYEEDPTTIDDAVNQVIVEWFDPEQKEERSTAPLHALGAIQATGGIISETISYPEIPVESLALRAGARELRNKATPLKRMRLVCNRTPYAWRIGTYFRLQAPKRGIADMVCLVGDIDTGTLRSGAIPLVALQDVFAMPETTYVVAQPSPPDENAVPTPPPQQLLAEAPYVELVESMSPADLAVMPADAGFVFAVGTQPDRGINYRLYTAAGGEGLAETGVGDWCPTATVAALADTAGTGPFALATQSLLHRVSLGSVAIWDGELVRVDALDTVAGTVELGRGCADTVGQEHAAGSRVYFFDEWAATDGRQYSQGETVTAKLLSRTSSAVLAIDAAIVVTTEMDARAVRPYPPAGVEINGESAPIILFGEVTATWAHRDRLLQADQLVDQTMASIGPEPGTTYSVYWYLDDAIVQTHTGVAGNSQAYTPTAGGGLRVEIESERDGITSWQRQVRQFIYTTTESYLRVTEAGDPRITESGASRITE